VNEFPFNAEDAEENALSPLRLGVVSYLNAVPLVYGLEDDPRFTLVRDVPARIAERLHAGEIDLGMIPSVEYAAGDYAIVPGIGIASRGAVRSVNLFHRRPVAELRRVALDASSRTSVALAKILLRDRLGHDPEYVTMGPPVEDMLGSADAALVIGDPALYFRGDADRLDLGEEWTARTGLSFVFAFWAGRPGAVDAAGVHRLQEALRAGQAAFGRIAAQYNGLGAGRGAESEAYLRRNIVYDLGEGELAGLREFYRRARALGLIERVPELRFHGGR
jgi:chorismate dehydratase